MHDPDVYEIRKHGSFVCTCEGLDQLLDTAQEVWNTDEVNLSVVRHGGSPEMLIIPKLSYKLLGAADSNVVAGRVYGAVYARNQPDWEDKLKIFVTTDDNGNSMMLEANDYDLVAMIHNI